MLSGFAVEIQAGFTGRAELGQADQRQPLPADDRLNDHTIWLPKGLSFPRDLRQPSAQMCKGSRAWRKAF